jgi:hypothetical protein
MRLQLDSVSANMQSRIAEQRSLQILLYVGLMRCTTQVQSVVRMIFVANIALFYSVMEAITSTRELPSRISFDAPAVLEDAFGRCMPIHAQCINSWKVCLTGSSFALLLLTD